MANLKISPEQAILLLNERIDAIRTIEQNNNGLDYYDFIRWCSKTWAAVDEIYKHDDPRPEEIRTLGLSNCSCNAHTAALVLAEAYHARLQEYINEIRASVKISR